MHIIMFIGVLVPFLLSSSSAAYTRPVILNEQFTIQIRILYASFCTQIFCSLLICSYVTNNNKTHTIRNFSC